MFKYDSNELYYACIVTRNHFDQQYIRFYINFICYYIELCNMDLITTQIDGIVIECKL